MSNLPPGCTQRDVDGDQYADAAQNAGDRCQKCGTELIAMHEDVVCPNCDDVISMREYERIEESGVYEERGE